MLIQFSAIWTAQNPSKNELHAEDDCGALATRHPDAIHRAQGDSDDTEPWPLGFSGNFRVIQFGIGLYSLGMVIQFHEGRTYFIWRGCRENKTTATGRRPKTNGCARTSETDF